MAKDELTPKQKMFVKEYLVDLNATQAYLRCGYKCKNEKVASVMASRLLANDKVARAIEEAKQKRSEKLELSAEWVLENLKNIAVRCQQAEPVMAFDYQARQMTETGEYSFDSKGANRALELIGKHLGMFTDKVDLNANMVVFKGEDKLED